LCRKDGQIKITQLVQNAVAGGCGYQHDGVFQRGIEAREQGLTAHRVAPGYWAMQFRAKDSEQYDWPFNTS